MKWIWMRVIIQSVIFQPFFILLQKFGYSLKPRMINGYWKLDPDIPDIKPGYLTVYDEGSLANIPRGCELDWDYLKEIGIEGTF